MRVVRWGVHSRQIGQRIVQSQGYYSCERHQVVEKNLLSRSVLRRFSQISFIHSSCSGLFETTSEINTDAANCSLTRYSSRPPMFPLIATAEYFNQNELRDTNF